MGRVRRYKKLKACDPCAPKRGRGDADEKYDLPPALSDDEGNSRKRRRQEKRWERDALRDDEYVELLEEKAKRSKKLPEVAIQPKQPNESMKAFQHRVRQESKALLRASNAANSATQQRRREFMRQRKKEKKLRRKQRAGALTHEEVEAQLAEERERAVFGREQVAFGETNDAPPDHWGLKLPRLHKAKPSLLLDEDDHGHDGDGDDSDGGGGKPSRKPKPKQKPKQKQKGQQKPERTSAEKAERARLREEAQQAYRAMRVAKNPQQGPRL